MRTTSTSLLAILVALSPATAESQRTYVIDDAPSCPQCRVLIQHVVRLGDRDGEGFVGEPLGFAPSPKGGWYLTHTSDPSSVFEFAADGQFVRRLGRRGDGPGEFRGAGQILESDSTLTVVDVFGNRVVVFDTSGTTIRTSRLPPLNASDIAVGSDGQLVLAGTPLGGPTRNIPLHVADGDRIVRSFGGLPGAERPTSPQVNVRWIDVGESSIWAAHMLSYRLDEWSLDGQLRRSLERRATWFPRGETMNIPTEQPVPMIVGIRRIDELLWVIVRVPDANWTGALGSYSDRLKGPNITPDGYWDSVVEVIDLRTQQVVARTRVDEALMRPRTDGTTASYSEDEAGYPFVHIWQMSLTR